MKQKVRILNLEDNPGDFQLIRAGLVSEGIECDLVRVESRKDFEAALEGGGFDLILADYSLPSFDGLSALKIVKDKCPDMPFIFVSGAIGEEFAVETLRRGATDYILKDRLSRLAPSIKRALLEVEQQAKRKLAERELEEHRRHLEELVRERTAELKETNDHLQRELVERRKLEKKLRTASITDELTGLLNRRGFLLFAQKYFGIASRNKRNFSILYLDLNEMKKINDEFGHREGDQALVDTANILKKTFRASDIIARMGGDEFTVLISEPRGYMIEKTIAGHIYDYLRMHNERTEKVYRLSVSMGMAHYDPEKPCSVEELLDRADELMYENKQRRELGRETIPSSKGGKNQKREYERRRTDAGIAVELAVSGKVVIKDISVSGISVRTSQRLAKNAVYGIRVVSAGGEELTLRGLVVWSSLTGKASGEGDTEPYYEAGLRFTELNDDLISSLERLIVCLSK